LGSLGQSRLKALMRGSEAFLLSIACDRSVDAWFGGSRIHDQRCRVDYPSKLSRRRCHALPIGTRKGLVVL